MRGFAIAPWNLIALLLSLGTLLVACDPTRRGVVGVSRLLLE